MSTFGSNYFKEDWTANWKLFCLANSAVVPEVSFYFQTICLTPDQCCYFSTPQLGICHAIWNKIPGTAQNPLNAHG